MSDLGQHPAAADTIALERLRQAETGIKAGLRHLAELDRIAGVASFEKEATQLEGILKSLAKAQQPLRRNTASRSRKTSHRTDLTRHIYAEISDRDLLNFAKNPQPAAIVCQEIARRYARALGTEL